MKQISFTQFKTILARDIKDTKSFNVTSDGELLFMCVVPHGETAIRNNLIAIVDEAVLINNNFGKKEVDDSNGSS